MDRQGIEALWFTVVCLIIDDYFKTRCKQTRKISHSYFYGDLKPSLAWMCDACDLNASWVVRRVNDFQEKSKPPYRQINLGKYILGEWGKGSDYKRYKRGVNK